MRPLVCDLIAGLPMYVPGRSIEMVKREFGVEEVIKLASNESPYGPSPKAMEAMRRAVNQVHRYPDDGVELRETLAATLGVLPEQVLLGAGATDLIELMARTFGTPDGHALFSTGSFIAYRIFLMAHGVPFSETPLSSWGIDLEALAAAATPNTQLLYLPNPNNPTGSRFDQASFDRFLAKLPDHVVLVLDDAYRDYDDAALDTVMLVRHRPRTIVLRTFSKAHGLAGMRVGYAVSSEEVIGALRQVQRPHAVARLALAGALAALGDHEHLEKTVAGTREGRALLTERLGELGFTVLPSAANFVTVELPTPIAAAEFTDQLLRRGCIIRPLATFDLPSSVRFSMGTKDELEAALTSVAAVLREAPQLLRPRAGDEEVTFD